MDTTYRRPAATLVCRVFWCFLLVFLVVLALPLDFTGRLRVLRTKFCFVPCAVLRLLVFPLGCSRSLGLLSSQLFGLGRCLWLMMELCTLLDGPVGGDPGFYIVWCRFRLLRRYLVYRPLEIPRLKKPLGRGLCWLSWAWACAPSGSKCSCSWLCFGILTVRVGFGLVFLS